MRAELESLAGAARAQSAALPQSRDRTPEAALVGFWQQGRRHSYHSTATPQLSVNMTTPS